MLRRRERRYRLSSGRATRRTAAPRLFSLFASARGEAARRRADALMLAPQSRPSAREGGNELPRLACASGDRMGIGNPQRAVTPKAVAAPAPETNHRPTNIGW